MNTISRMYLVVNRAFNQISVGMTMLCLRIYHCHCNIEKFHQDVTTINGRRLRYYTIAQ